jgi:ketosteroid isomerase-like protein
MSRKNIEIVRRCNAAFNESDIGAFLECFAPDAELHDLGNAPDQSRSVAGRAAIGEVVSLWTAAFDDFRAEIEEYIDEGDAVICSVHWRGEGKASGVSVDLHQFDLMELSDGRIVRATVGLRSKAEALEAAGLAE